MQIQAVVSFAHLSGKPEDRVVNTFCFEYPGADDPDKDQKIVDALVKFYNTVPSTQAKSVANYLGSQLSRVAAGGRIDLYSLVGHLDGTRHGSPLATYVFTLAMAGLLHADWPSEVAITASFHAAYGLLAEEIGNTRPKSRRRGRIYLGPLTQQTGVEDSTFNKVTVAPGVTQVISNAMKDLMNDPDTNWCVWSRKDQLTESVVGGFVDEAFDTRRSRGEKSVARAIFGV